MVEPAVEVSPAAASTGVSTELPPQFAGLLTELREELTHLRVEIDDDGEPVLLRRDGSVVDTWRQGYPYDHRMTRHEYDRTKRLLQIELLKLQRWVKDRRERLLLVFEGRDTAGNGGTIQRFTEHLNPAARTSSRWRSRTSARRRSGTSSPTSSTTGPASSGS